MTTRGFFVGTDVAVCGGCFLQTRCVSCQSDLGGIENLCPTCVRLGAALAALYLARKTASLALPGQTGYVEMDRVERPDRLRLVVPDEVAARPRQPDRIQTGISRRPKTLDQEMHRFWRVCLLIGALFVAAVFVWPVVRDAVLAR